MHDLDLALSLWLEAQSGSYARAVKKELLRLSRENEQLRERIDHLVAGFPDGVTRQEWTIIRELRACTPSDGTDTGKETPK